MEPTTHTVKLVGMTFVPGYPENVHNLTNAWHHAELVRNPGNPHDANAIEVHVGGAMFGHIPRDFAARLTPLLDQGGVWKAEACPLIDPSHPKNPGVHVTLERVAAPIPDPISSLF